MPIVAKALENFRKSPVLIFEKDGSNIISPQVNVPVLLSLHVSVSLYESLGLKRQHKVLEKCTGLKGKIPQHRFKIHYFQLCCLGQNDI